jgi:type I restriction enzyme, S subunit
MSELKCNGADFPDTWQVQRLSALNTKKAPSINPAAFGEETFEYYSIPAYQDGQRPALTQGREIGSSKLLLESRTVLFGKLNPRVEKVWQVGNFSNHRKIGSTEWIPIIPNDEIEPAFVFYLLWSEHVMPKAKGMVSGSTPSRQRVDPRSFYRIQVPVPPLPEQRKIAAVLGLVQRAIEQQDRLIALTTELKKALLHKLFTEGFRGEPQKQTEIGPIPESWEVVPLREVCTFLSGGTPSKKRPDFWEGTIPWVSPKDMKKPRLSDVTDHISDAALEDGSSLAPAGSVFVVIRGMILAKDVPVALAEVPMAFNQDMKAIIPGPRVVPSFLLYALVEFKQNLSQKVGRSAHGTMTLMSSELEQFSIPVPDRRTQEEIAAAIQTVELKHEIHRGKHTALNDLFRTLLHLLMTAQIRVHDLDLDEILGRTGTKAA